MSTTNQRQTHSPPVARGLPVVGSVFSLLGDIRAFLTEQYLELGPVFRIHALNRKLTVLAGAEANVFANEEGAKYLCSGPDWTSMVAAMGAERAIANMDGPDHLRLRRATSSSYTRSFAEENIAEMVAITRREIHEWPLDKPIPAHHAFQRISADLLGTLNTGTPSREYLDDLIALVRTILLVYLAHKRPSMVLHTPGFQRTRKRIDAFVSNIVAAHAPEQRRNKTPDLVDDLLALHRMDPEFLPEHDLKAAVLTPFFAALDSLSSMCAITVYTLVHYPDLRERMTEEADKLFANGIPDVNALRQIDVTHRIAMETLRMYPPVPALVRAASSPFDFSGYHFSEGEAIIVGTTVPHYLPQFFSNPERFDIDRYNPERMEHHQPGAFAPWGVGAHICPGNGFAEVAMAVVMLTVVHDTELALHPPDYELKKFKSTPVFTPDGSFKFRVTRRRSSPAGASRS